jgi:hypothetical protein
MADLQNFRVTAGDAATVTVPQHTIEGELVDSTSGATLANYTGDDALRWPSVLSTLTADQRDEIAQTVAQRLIQMKAGIA